VLASSSSIVMAISGISATSDGKFEAPSINHIDLEMKVGLEDEVSW